MLAQKQQLLVRYYLWATDGPWRLPSRLHYDLIDRKVALAQYAATKQKVLEVFARRIGVDTAIAALLASISAAAFAETKRVEQNEKAIKAEASRKYCPGQPGGQAGVAVGMTKQQVLSSCGWGKPMYINTTVTTDGTREQLVYGLCNARKAGLCRSYVYLTNGVVTAFQSSD